MLTLFTVLDREVKEEESHDPSDRSIRCPLCGWSPRKDDKWSAPADASGTPSTQEECAPPACTGGLKPSASLVPDGRRTRSGTHSDLQPDTGQHADILAHRGNSMRNLGRFLIFALLLTA